MNGELELIMKARRYFQTGEARRLRLAVHWSLAEAAQAASVSRSGWYRYENGQRIPRPTHAVSCGRVLEHLERQVDL